MVYGGILLIATAQSVHLASWRPAWLRLRVQAQARWAVFQASSEP